MNQIRISIPKIFQTGGISLSPWDCLLFILGYVALDWVSYLHPLHGLNITPWNPSPALGLVFWLQHGIAAGLPWFLAILAGEILIRGMPDSLAFAGVLAGMQTLGYGLIGALLRHQLRQASLPKETQGLLTWALIVVAGSLLTSGLFVWTLRAGGHIPVGDGYLAWMRAWIGDCVGIIASMPFLWLLLDRARRSQIGASLLTAEAAAQGLLAVAMLWISFGLGGVGEFQYFYLLFLPIVWAAARQGMTGAAIAAFTIQVGVIIAIHLMNIVTVTVFELQMLGAALSFVGLFIGTVVDEKERASRELRHSLRLAAAGEMAAALAHELNQPLTALSAYGSASRQLLERGETGPILAETIGRMSDEAKRAAGVVRRLRDFFRTGATQLESLPLKDLVARTVEHFRDKARHQAVELEIESMPTCHLLVDGAQIEVVLRNLLANAMDAVVEQPVGMRWVHIGARLADDFRIELIVEDGGPGLSESDRARLFEPFQSSKSSGLGLGLAISRAIAQAHGGDLRAEPGGGGRFKLILPLDE